MPKTKPESVAGSNGRTATAPDRGAPTQWASALGAMMFLFGILLAATHANEWMKQSVIANSTPASQQLPAADCPADELEEEGLSLAECEHLVSSVQGFALSVPEWFPPLFIVISALGTFIALASIVVGTALADARPWAPRASTAVLAALTALDVAAFIAVVNSGPILRAEYLWSIMMWLAVHIVLTAASVAGSDSESTTEPLTTRNHAPEARGGM